MVGDIDIILKCINVNIIYIQNVDKYNNIYIYTFSICKHVLCKLVIYHIQVKTSSCSQLGSFEDLEASPPKHPQKHWNSRQKHDNPNSKPSKPPCETGIGNILFKRSFGKPHPKKEVLNLIRQFWGWVFPYISLTSDFGVEPYQCNPVTQRSLLRMEKAQRWRRTEGWKKQVNLRSSERKWMEMIGNQSHTIHVYMVYLPTFGRSLW